MPRRPDFARKSDQEVAERLAEAVTAITGKSKPDPRPIRGGVDFYAVLRKWACQTGQGHGRASWRQIAAQLYPDVVTIEDTRRKKRALGNHAARLEAAGVARVRPWVGPSGEWRGIYWELIDEPVNAAILGGVVSPCSSTGDATEVPGLPSVTCELRVRHTPSRKREPGVTRIAPYRFRTGKGSKCRFELDFGPPIPRPAPFFAPALLAPPVVEPSELGSTSGTSLVDDRFWDSQRDLGSAREEQQQPLETRDPVALARSRVREMIQASLRSAKAPGTGERGAAGLIAETFAAYEASELQRLAAVERLAAIVNPTYDQVADVFHLVRGSSFPHARRAMRERIVSGARRYDRYALRLAVEGHVVPFPTAMARVAALARGDHGESIGYAGAVLKRESLMLRSRWRDLHPDEVDAAARKRRDRRVRRKADELRREADGTAARLCFRQGGRGRPDMIPERAAAELARLDAELADARTLVEAARA